jgi:hypothetical protein
MDVVEATLERGGELVDALIAAFAVAMMLKPGLPKTMFASGSSGTASALPGW